MFGLQMLKVGEGDIPGPELYWMSAWEEWFRLDLQVGLIRGNDVVALEAWDRVRLLEREDEIAPGIRTWWAGDHHRATLAVDVDTSAGGAVLSDVFFSFRNVTANHPIGICENIYEALAAYERARATARHIIPLYEPLVFDRYPDGVIAASA